MDKLLNSGSYDRTKQLRIYITKISAKPYKPSITEWQVTLSAFLLLVPELFEKMKFVLLSHFNPDALENYFSQVRRKGGSNDHPTPVYFLQRTRMLLAE
ncbi:hypothetical protein AVEN_186017-1 [Araneus ventricosus]|uniref:Transposable element P transposase-like RNase H C-terminal domain-containing protein n=1 Tax=Araneus ventricosus TaxID=182803 RepID=A0A4Y2J3D8_ARAVE|nr:hypothetical protein AVEN_186017-1 [Araneus ventricosus]